VTIGDQRLESKNLKTLFKVRKWWTRKIKCKLCR